MQGALHTLHRLLVSCAVFFSVLVVGVTVAGPQERVMAAASSDPAFETMLGSQAIGDGLNTTGVIAAVKVGSVVYFGGTFTKVNGDSSVKYLAKYDPSTDSVSAVTGWGNAGAVYSLATDGTYLFVGGTFQNAGGVATADLIAKFNTGTSTWTGFLKSGAQAVTYGTTYMVNSLAWDSTNSTLIAGGFFTNVSGVASSAYLLAITSATSANSTFSSIGAATCVSPGITSLLVSSGNLYATGNCSAIAKDPSNVAIPYVARKALPSGTWDEIASSRLTYSSSTSVAGLKVGTSTAAFPRAVAVDSTSSTVYVGGGFSYFGINSSDTGKTVLNYLMKANSNPSSRSAWGPVSTESSVGVYTTVTTTAVMSLTALTDGVVIGGSFTKPGGLTIGAALSTAESTVRYMARIRNSGPTAGTITTFGGGSAGGTVWLNSTVRGIVDTTSVTQGGSASNFLIPFGSFSNASGIGANDAVGLLATDGTSWGALGATAPLNATAYATAVTADNRYVYVGGDFTGVGAVSGADYLAVYDRTTKAWSVPVWWYSAATTSRFKVRALKISGNYIYIAGVAEGTKGLYVYRADATLPAAVSPTTPTAVNGTKIAAGGTIHALEFDQSGRLIVGGTFSKVTETTYCAAGSGIKNLFRLVLAGTETCEVIGSNEPVGASGVVYSISSGTVNGLPQIVVGGNFQNIQSDATLDYVAVWDDSAGSSGTGAWLGVGTVAGNGPVQNIVRTTVLNGNMLYLGGAFEDAGGDVEADYLASVNLSDNSWSDLGTTPAGNVYSLAQVGSTLFVGGDFAYTSTIASTRALIQISLAAAGQDPHTSIAARVGQTGGSINTGSILAMAKKRVGSGATADNYIYIAGDFTDLGGDTAGDRIGLVHPTINEITLAGNAVDSPMEASPIPLVATSDSGLPVSATNNTPSVCTWSANQISLVSIGTCTITFTQSGGGGFASASPVTATFEVTKGTDAIDFPTLTSRAYTPSPIDPGVTAASGRSATLTATQGNNSVCRITAGAVELLGTGTCEVTASLGANSDWDAATDVVQSFTVSAAAQTVTFGAPGEQEVGTPLVLSATASSGLSVSYSSSTPSVCSLSGATLSFSSGGDCTIVASQSGSAQYSPAPDVSRTFYVWPGSRYDLSWNTWEFPAGAVTVGTSATVRALAQQTANAAATTEVSWVVDTPGVCTLSSTLGSGRRTLTPVAAGTCTLTLSRAADTQYRALASRSVSVTVDAAPTTTVAVVTQTTVATTTGGSSAGQSSVVNINNTYTLPKQGSSKYKTVTVPLKPAVKGETFKKISSSPRNVCNVGNFGTSKKPNWKIVMSRPGTCRIAMTMLKANKKSTYNASTTVIVK